MPKAMGGSNCEAGSATDPSFWAIRNSLLPATRDMERAADLLSEAADMILKNRDREAVALIQQADITMDDFALREQAVRKPPVCVVHRLRPVADIPPPIPPGQRAPPVPAPLREAVFLRDGWRCRYCGCRVIPPKVRRRIDKRLPGAIRFDRADIFKCHSGFWSLWGSVDHIIPRALGGSNEMENLVTACMVCNFAREDYTLEQTGLANPFSRPPILDGWDGLTRLLAKPPPTRTPPGTPPPHLAPEQRFYTLLKASCPDVAQPLQVFLAGLVDVGVMVEFVRSAVLRFSIGARPVSAGNIRTNGRMECGDAYYFAQNHGHSDIGDRYLSIVADLTDGQVSTAGQIPQVVGPDGKWVKVADLLPNADLWRNAIADFVSAMRMAMNK